MHSKNEEYHIHLIYIMEVASRGLGDELTTENDGEGNEKAGNVLY